MKWLQIVTGTMPATILQFFISASGLNPSPNTSLALNMVIKALGSIS
jgi:hypothetical protein